MNWPGIFVVMGVVLIVVACPPLGIVAAVIAGALWGTC